VLAGCRRDSRYAVFVTACDMLALRASLRSVKGASRSRSRERHLGAVPPTCSQTCTGPGTARATFGTLGAKVPKVSEKIAICQGGSPRSRQFRPALRAGDCRPLPALQDRCPIQDQAEYNLNHASAC